MATEQYVKLTKDMVEAARESAKAAQLALTADRPYLLVDSVQYSVERPSGYRVIIAANIVFRNFGKGPALVDELLLAMDMVERVPNPRDYSNCIRWALTSGAVAAGERTECKAEHALQISDFDALQAGTKKHLIVYGLLTYKDVFKEPEPYKTGFLWTYSRPLKLLKEVGRFVYDGDKHNFST